MRPSLVDSLWLYLARHISFITLKLLFKLSGSYVYFLPQTDTKLPAFVISMIQK